MKIKLAILENDPNCLNRMVSVFNARYADTIEIYSFTDPAGALAALDNAKIDVFIASDAFEIDTAALPKRCGFAYFSESPDAESVRGQRAVGKYQKADLIYKQILSIYSETAGSGSWLRPDDENARVVVFGSPCGGTGTSCAAAAYSAQLARNGKRTLYLNLEKFGVADAFFTGEGRFGMSDVIFAVKSKKSNLALKLESCVRQSGSGVCYFSGTGIALDMCELTGEETMRLLSELRLTGAYDVIVVDADFSLDEAFRKLLSLSQYIVWVCDGSAVANGKIERAYAALRALDASGNTALANRVMLLYNQFSNKTGHPIADVGLKSIGGAPRYEHATAAEVVEQLSQSNLFAKLI